MRASGILMPITSLPSKWGVGTLGAEARSFIDFLKASGQTYWQILPIGPTSYGDSPYQSFSSFAGNPYLIDLDDLVAEGLLKKSDFSRIGWGKDPECVDYGKLYKKRFDVLRKAVNNLVSTRYSEFCEFCANEDWWLNDYAFFMSIKAHNNGAAWTEWPDDLRMRNWDVLRAFDEEHVEEMTFWRGVQFLFNEQWQRFKGQAEAAGIKIIGDLPIYVAGDSVDAWAAPDQFQLDEKCEPIEVAGCPPDGFSADGQLWGNPLYDWDRMADDGYEWWMRRISYQYKFYDVLRIDHFRGFESYYAIPAGNKTAAGGRWKQGPGIRFFHTLKAKLGDRAIIAEDLGFLTSEVHEMLRESGYPGMKVLQFAFDSRDGGAENYLPYKYPANSVAYVGTHDNDTAVGWLKTAPKDDVAMAREYLHLDKKEGEAWGLMRTIWASASDTVIVTMQDLLELGSDARINTPSTLGGNWVWRAKEGFATPELAARIHRQAELYRRLP